MLLEIMKKIALHANNKMSITLAEGMAKITIIMYISKILKMAL